MGLHEEEQNWKDKYLASLDQLERQEKHWKEVEELFRHGISRVALAAQGVDPALDRDLNLLRKTIRRDEAYNDLSRIVESISQSVKMLDERRREQAPQLHPQAAWMVNLLEQLQLPTKLQARATKLRGKLSKLGTDQDPDACLQQTAHLCNQAFAMALPKEKHSLLQRLLGRDDDIIIEHPVADVAVEDTQDADPTIEIDAVPTQLPDPRQVLLVLLKQIPDTFLDKQQALSLTKRLSAIPSPLTNTPNLGQLSESVQQCLSVAITEFIAAIVSAKKSPDPTKLESVPIGPDPHLEGGKGNASDNDNGLRTISEFCVQLLETLSFPHEFQAPATALRNRIVAGIKEPEVDDVINGLTNLIVATRQHIEQERNDLQDFLLQLTGHLEDIDEHLSGAKVCYAKEQQQHSDFNDHLSEQMQQLQLSVQQASDLPALQDLIRERVTAIRLHLAQQRDLDLRQQHELAQALSHSTAKLLKLEQEGHDLRQKLTQEHAQAIHDALTGIHNRLAYQERVELEFIRWKRYRTPLSLLIFDVDHFKRINDEYGHKAGDKALRMIAKHLKNEVRECDFVARYGGEEFVVLMPETDIESAMAVANKLRIKISGIHFHYNDASVPVTMSAGAALFTENDSIDSVFQRADQALYQAKQNGRNQCYTAPV